MFTATSLLERIKTQETPKKYWKKKKKILAADRAPQTAVQIFSLAPMPTGAIFWRIFGLLYAVIPGLWTDLSLYTVDC
jgi:hypothetical protein